MIENDSYEERIVAFIDILGFSEHIKRTVDNNEYFTKIKQVLNLTKEIKNHNDHDRFSSRKDKGKEVSIFSDSIVISYLIGEHGDLLLIELLVDIVHLQIEMLERGILVRGGITVGNLVHEDNIVFGPGMIKAYGIESKIANYPRIIVDELVLERFKIKDLDYILELVKLDYDGQYFVDFLNEPSELNDHREFVRTLHLVKNILVEEINTSNIIIESKYKWLKIYFNNACMRSGYTDLEI